MRAEFFDPANRASTFDRSRNPDATSSTDALPVSAPSRPWRSSVHVAWRCGKNCCATQSCSYAVRPDRMAVASGMLLTSVSHASEYSRRLCGCWSKYLTL